MGEAAEVVAGSEFVGIERDGIFFREGYHAGWTKHALEVEVEFGFGQLPEEEVEIGRRGHRDSLAGRRGGERMPQRHRITEKKVKELQIQKVDELKRSGRGVS